MRGYVNIPLREWNLDSEFFEFLENFIIQLTLQNQWFVDILMGPYTQDKIQGAVAKFDKKGFGNRGWENAGMG